MIIVKTEHFINIFIVSKKNAVLNILANPEVKLILLKSILIFFHDQLNRVIKSPNRVGKIEQIKKINNT